ncbi:hypothetical protein BO221_17790 [Archangium sp. Cb G35]|uniref:hypothetical protein n=1 Tax=Archangium sp. Cb G35 TaxID=1920190 RepID=UPI000936BFBD|nr:hypothetical protein [Archangium sp. Cb G35]OJT23819.1 hypothetical protein BO221_17790 [Archangium sp. Cb G35]
MMDTKKLRIEAGLAGCFSATRYQLEIDARNDPCQVVVTEISGVGSTLGQMSIHRVPRALVEPFIGTVAKIIGTPQRLIGNRSSTVYHVKVDARDMPGLESIEARSSDIPKKQLAKYLNDEKANIELRQKIQAAMLDCHDWAHELFAVTEEFIARCRSEFAA